MLQRTRVYLIVVAILAGTFGVFGVALLRGGDTSPHAATTPGDTVPTRGAAIGFAAPSPSPLHAAFTVPVPHVDLTSRHLPLPDANVDIYPADIVTLAGHAEHQTVDGVGDQAGFSTMGGVAVVGRTAYVMTLGAVRTVDLDSGTVGTLAGSATGSGCVAGSSGAETRFGGLPGNAATDGESIFVADGACGIARVSIVTGATNFLVPSPGPLAVGPDGHLYASPTSDGGGTIVRIDPASGTQQTYLSLAPGNTVLGMTADSMALWVSVDEGPSAPSVIDRVAFADGSVTRYAAEGIDVVGAGQLASAGKYLYAPSVSGLGVLRFSKDSGAWGLVIGDETPGNRDGVWHNAELRFVRGLASDGLSAIWVSDDGNYTFRKLEFNSGAAMHLGG